MPLGSEMCTAISRSDKSRLILERVVNFFALFAVICLRSPTIPAVISLVYGTKGLSN